MGFQIIQTNVEVEPFQRSRTMSRGRNNTAEEGAGAEEGDEGSPEPHHIHTMKFGRSPQELSPDPDALTTCGPEEGGAGAVRPAAALTHGGAAPSAAVDSQLQALLVEVQFLVERVREQDRQLSVSEQWQFAAAVIDRLCLVGFSVFNIICTIAILMAAPNFGEALSKDFLWEEEEKKNLRFENKLDSGAWGW